MTAAAVTDLGRERTATLTARWNNEASEASITSEAAVFDPPDMTSDQVKDVASCENFAEILLPKNVTEVMATIAMKATRIPYSARAAPCSSAKNFLVLSKSEFIENLGEG